MSVRILFVGLLLALPLDAARLDVEGVGGDLNGWDGRGEARYSSAGANFAVSRPERRATPAGGLSVTMALREARGAGRVYEATIRLEIGPGGAVQAVSVDGSVDGKRFDSGTITRPEPIEPAPAADGEEVGEEALFGGEPPANPDQAMRQDLADALSAALARARSSEKVVKRDLSAWIFGSGASPDASLVEGTMAAVGALFRHAD